ncbi:hypothetical protein [Actinosynnema sp. ALI-1.44]|uniref:hypothetical protein n=1 Tax=Actinosynnema sp. ALI-1.44 TaxID=1933779 RepID=UPI001EDA0291|nr:hypothetical protein [Actinosynnema sp. ALI-1.44]
MIQWSIAVDAVGSDAEYLGQRGHDGVSGHRDRVLHRRFTQPVDEVVVFVVHSVLAADQLTQPRCGQVRVEPAHEFPVVTGCHRRLADRALDRRVQGRAIGRRTVVGPDC